MHPHPEVLKHMAGVLKAAGFLVLTPREHVLATLVPRRHHSSDGWVSGSEVEQEFECYGAMGFCAKDILAQMLKEGIIECHKVNDQGAEFPYYRKRLRSQR